MTWKDRRKGATRTRQCSKADRYICKVHKNYLVGENIQRLRKQRGKIYERGKWNRNQKKKKKKNEEKKKKKKKKRNKRWLHLSYTQ